MTRVPPKGDPEIEAQIEAQIEALHAEVRQLAQTVLKLAEAQTAGLTSRLDDLAQSGRDGVNAAKTEAQRVLDDAADFARTKPLKALGFAALFGVVFGLLLGRR